MGNFGRRAIRYAGFAAVGLVVFVFALQMTFPYDRVRDKLVDALSDKYDVSIGEVERGIIPGRVYFKAFRLQTRPAKKEDTPSSLYIEKLEVDMGILALFSGAAKVNIDAKIGAGHITGSVKLSKGGTVIDLDGSDLPSAGLPMKEAIGLPMSGKLDFSVDLDLPNDTNKAGQVKADWTKAEGAISFACPNGCTVGDGKTRLQLKAKNARSQAFAEGGIEFGTVKLDSLVAKVDIKGGHMLISKFETKSPDGEVHVEFDATLAQDLNESLVAGCLRFKGTDELAKREPHTFAALQTTGAPQGPDGLFHIRLDGKLKEVKRLGQVCGAAMNAGQQPEFGGKKTIPTVTIEKPAPTVAPAPPPPPVAVPPPPPTLPAMAMSPMLEPDFCPISTRSPVQPTIPKASNARIRMGIPVSKLRAFV